ncbi:hypothetical protein cyc_01908 [Cyclospora cayetanensis]|uniref:Transmembrane protein n=1 Tax=Cyclospora cayetanensis TaxID=88456 RepID=A0A1D3CSS6_9EIME|nr:hypothetical protein cyc_01908 [Cyclospora cayetanensis]
MNYCKQLYSGTIFLSIWGGGTPHFIAATGSTNSLGSANATNPSPESSAFTLEHPFVALPIPDAETSDSSLDVEERFIKIVRRELQRAREETSHEGEDIDTETLIEESHPHSELVIVPRTNNISRNSTNNRFSYALLIILTAFLAYFLAHVVRYTVSQDPIVECVLSFGDVKVPPDGAAYLGQRFKYLEQENHIIMKGATHDDSDCTFSRHSGSFIEKDLELIGLREHQQGDDKTKEKISVALRFAPARGWEQPAGRQIPPPPSATFMSQVDYFVHPIRSGLIMNRPTGEASMGSSKEQEAQARRPIGVTKTGDKCIWHVLLQQSQEASIKKPFPKQDIFLLRIPETCYLGNTDQISTRMWTLEELGIGKGFEPHQGPCGDATEEEIEESKEVWDRPEGVIVRMYIEKEKKTEYLLPILPA